MTVPVWPLAVLNSEAATLPRLAPRSLSGGASISGRTQVVASDAGVWVATLSSIPVTDRDEVLAWRAIEAYCDGRLNAIDVPLPDYEQAYAPFGADLSYEALFAPVSHGDGSYFSDGSGYVSSVIDVTAGGDLALGATSMTAVVTYAPRLQPGQVFSFDHTNKGPRWYQVKSWDTETSAMTFRPPLREAVTSGATLNFDRPTCRMRLRSDDAMRLDLRQPAWGNPSVEFIEDL
ncbi:hypothetical protein K1W69_17530 [Hoeflea sp. WL0058]|uniref:Uncharacterized protein n=1 Tax=Flavimaribacter sediminis TaxID=2865987 RepID=A0AAE2ZT10_9HYPH|nr:hypothetical protein [Flavimaribacter sediminis]MBW8639002.1 hypothetical protein [Flavimaribacter sediminis]